jgi:beta-lactam-binding protein with PASTA domain
MRLNFAEKILNQESRNKKQETRNKNQDKNEYVETQHAASKNWCPGSTITIQTKKQNKNEPVGTQQAASARPGQNRNAYVWKIF